MSVLLPQAALPSVPPDTKLSKLDVLVLATNYIAHLTETLEQGATLAERAPPPRPGGYLHPVKVRTGTRDTRPSSAQEDTDWQTLAGREQLDVISSVAAEQFFI